MQKSISEAKVNSAKPPQIQQLNVTTAYQGVVPPPEMLENFNKINPTYSDKIMQMTLDASARQTAIIENQKAQIEYDKNIQEKEIDATKEIKKMEILGRNSDAFFKNINFLVGQIFSFALVSLEKNKLFNLHYA